MRNTFDIVKLVIEQTIDGQRFLDRMNADG